jgi:hypothetical protein
MKPIVILDRLSTSNKSQNKKRGRGRPKSKLQHARGRRLPSPSFLHFEVKSEIVPEKIEVIEGLTTPEFDNNIPILSRHHRSAKKNQLMGGLTSDEDEIDVKFDPEEIITSFGRPKRLTRSVTNYVDNPNDFPGEDAECEASDTNPCSSSSDDQVFSDDEEELVTARPAKRRIVDKQPPTRKKSVKSKLSPKLVGRPKKASSVSSTAASSHPKQTLHHLPGEEKIFECRICSIFFTSIRKRSRHNMQLHRKDLPFKCRYCPRGFLQSNSLREHENWHKTDQPWACDHCDARFVEKLALTGHKIRRHCLFDPQEDQHHKCELCLRRFEELSGLLGHIEESHGGGSQPPHHLNIQCYYCDRQPNFGNKEELKEHEATEAHRLTIQGKINIHCSLCRIKFTSTVELKAHLESEEHSNEHLNDRRRMVQIDGHTYCSVCRLPFARRADLLQHNKTDFHKAELSKWQLDTAEEWLCSYCGLDFGTSSKLKAHKKQKHSEKVRQCEVRQEYI